MFKSALMGSPPHVCAAQQNPAVALHNGKCGRFQYSFTDFRDAVEVHSVKMNQSAVAAHYIRKFRVAVLRNRRYDCVCFSQRVAPLAQEKMNLNHDVLIKGVSAGQIGVLFSFSYQEGNAFCRAAKRLTVLGGMKIKVTPIHQGVERQALSRLANLSISLMALFRGAKIPIAT